MSDIKKVATMTPTSPEEILESFLQPEERAIATHRLAELGIDAIPILKSLFSGEAKNRWGVSYSKLGMPIDCGLVTIQHLGTLAKPLESFVRDCLHSEHSYAAAALRAIGTLDEASIVALTGCLDKNGELAFEAAYALCCCEVEEHEAVIAVINSSPFASRILSPAKKFYLNEEIKQQTS